MTAITDWISAIATISATGIAGVAALIGLKTFAHQRTANDVEMAIGIFNEISRYWDRIVDTKDYSYNMGQILSYFEISCSLFNKSILTDSANIVLKDHIVEVFTKIQNDDNGKAFIGKCLASQNTFCELKKFSKRHMPQALNTLAFTDSA